MTFEEILNKACEMLQRRGRVSYRTLKRNFELDDEAIEDLKFELTKVKKIATEIEPGILSWLGEEKSEINNSSHDIDSLLGETLQDKAERRQLTVMFIDLVGSTNLSQKLDPEDFREVLYHYQVLFDSSVEKYQGLVVQHQGDGIVAYFGYPNAQEDDPRRAILAGLEMIHSLNELNLQLKKEKNVTIQIRIGLHTGLVVIGKAGGKGHSLMHAIGEGPNLASRIQNEAKPNTLLISDITNKLVGGYFETKSLGPFKLKGFADSVELYLVVGEREWNPLELASTGKSNPLVGREWERARILERWELARQSNGQFVLVTGEAGIGKTRLVYSLAAEISHRGKPPRTFRCSPYHRNAPFQPIIERLQHEIGLDQEHKDNSSLTKLEDYLREHLITDNIDIALFASLLSIPLTTRYEKELTMPPERRKSLTTATLANWMLEGKKASLILFEDIQWADPSTLELLGRILDNIPTTPVLFIATSRPEFQPVWKISSHLVQIVLNRLTREQTESMIRQLASDLPDFVLQDLLTKTDGNPLFIEEVTKLVLESGVIQLSKDGYQLKGSLKSLAIPNTLQDSLMARLDRLGPAKELAQIGATIGREFSYSLVKAISQLSDEALKNHLTKLESSQLLFSRGEIPNSIYTFKHALVQETAHLSLLKKRRQEFHRRIVNTLEKNLAEVIKTNPELLAHHCTEAGLLEKAVPYWKQAGELAVSRSAHAEAINHLNEGLLVLHQLPDSENKVHNEILIQIALGVPLTALRGYGSPEVERAYARASTLCQQAGEMEQLIPALYGLWRYYLLKAEYKEALVLSEKILRLSAQSNDPLHIVVAHRAVGSTNFYLGELDTAWLHLKEVISSKTVPEKRTGTLLYDVVDAWVTSRSYASWTLWLQGFPDQALEECNLSIEAAEQLNHPFSKVLTKSFASWLHQFRGESKETLECAKQGLVIAEENGFAFWVGWGKVLESWALDVAGKEGQLSTMKEGLDTWCATGSELGSSYFLYLLTDRYLAHGDLPNAWQCMDRAKEFIEKTGEHWWYSEICRLEGMLYLAAEEVEKEKAEECFRKALQVASGQKARSLELKAALSLANLLADSPRKSDGISILSEVVQEFHEGLYLPDLVKAKTLLHELS